VVDRQRLHRGALQADHAYTVTRSAPEVDERDEPGEVAPGKRSLAGAAFAPDARSPHVTTPGKLTTGELDAPKPRGSHSRLVAELRREVPLLEAAVDVPASNARAR
jgi:hypothetical protein